MLLGCNIQYWWTSSFHYSLAHAPLVPTNFLASGALTWYVFLTLLLLVTSSQAQCSAHVHPMRGVLTNCFFVSAILCLRSGCHKHILLCLVWLYSWLFCVRCSLCICGILPHYSFLWCTGDMSFACEYPFQDPFSDISSRDPLHPSRSCWRCLPMCIKKSPSSFPSCLRPWTDFTLARQRHPQLCQNRWCPTTTNLRMHYLLSHSSQRWQTKWIWNWKSAMLSASYSEQTTLLCALACSCFFVMTYSTVFVRCQCYITDGEYDWCHSSCDVLKHCIYTAGGSI